MISLYAGLTSQTIDLFIQDSTTGAGETGLVFNTSGLAICYRKGATGSFAAITLATQTVGGAWSSGGFVELDSTNAPGLYRLDIPNAVVDTAALVTLVVKGTGIISAPARIDCRALPVDVKLYGGSAGTFSGGRPEVNATHWGGTAIASAVVNANAIQISGDATAADNLEAACDGGSYNLGGGAIVAASVTGATGSVTGSVGSVTAAVTLPAIPADWITSSGIAGSAITEIQSGLATSSELQSVVGTNGAGLTAIPWNAAWDAEVQSECTDALNAYDPPTKTEQDAAFTEIKGAGWSSSTDTLVKIKVDTAVGRSAGVVTIGVISNAGTAVESYTYGGQTVAFTGLDASGNRSGVTVS